MQYIGGNVLFDKDAFYYINYQQETGSTWSYLQGSGNGAIVMFDN